MGVLAAALRELIALGVAGEHLVAAMERLEEADSAVRRDPQADRRRERDRDRKRSVRRSLRKSAESADSADGDFPQSEEPTLTSNTELTQTPIPPPLKPPALSLVATPKLKPTKRCPASWAPSPSVLTAGAEAGFSPGEIDRELAMMRDYEFRNTRSDWDAVARFWIRRSAKDRRPEHGPAAKQSAREANLVRSFAGAQDAARRRSEHG